MTPERRQRTEQLYHAALQHEESGRSAFLREACAGDDDLCREVESLLAEDGASDSFLERPAIQVAARQLAEEQARDLLGRQFGFYQILSFIGAGGMAEVYRARDTKLGREVAVKVLPKAFAQDPDRVARFEREARVLASLNHPNIATIHGLETWEDLHALVLELVPGETLAERISQGSLPVAQAVDICRQVAEALEAAHEKGIVHRDLKPANIKVTPEGRVKVLDFGLARVLGSQQGTALADLSTAGATGTRLILGTLAYMSPEQLRGQPVDKRADVWSFGCVLYECLSGQKAFGGQTASDSISATLTREPEWDALPASTSQQIRYLLERCLRKERNKRLHDIADARIELQEWPRERDQKAPPALPRDSEAALSKKAEFKSRVREEVPLRLPAAPLMLRRLQRLPRWMWAAMLGLAVTAGVWLIPPRSPPPSAYRQALAVVSLENLTQDRSLEWLDRGVAELVTTNLALAGTLDVVSPERMSSLISRRVKGEGRLPASQAAEVAREARAGLFVTGAVLKVGSRLRLHLRVQETATGRLLFSDKVEGEEAQAVFGMVDQVTQAMLAKLSPGQALPRLNVAASMTASVEALRAYQEGRNYFERFMSDQAVIHFRRASELDPRFTLAYLWLAHSLRIAGDWPAARQAIARAHELSAQAALPRLQKLMIQGAKLRFDGRLEEADPVLETAVREFPREIEPRLWLYNNRTFGWGWAESAPLLEEIVRLDERYPIAHNELAYAYALAGNLPRALASLDRYAALVPPNDPNPLDSRGDVLTINGRYNEAIAVYRKNLELNPGFVQALPALKLAFAYLYQGKYALAEANARPVYENNKGIVRAQAALALGDIEVGRGRLDRAMVRYEEAARLYLGPRPLIALMALLNAAHIALEQRAPQAALALGRRHPSPAAAGVRGTAYLLLGNEAAAKKEFASLRAWLAPLVGDYMAEKWVQFHRWQAAPYSGRWQQVIEEWPQLSRQLWQLFALDVGRAYVEMGLPVEAERHLQFVLAVNRMNIPDVYIRNFLAYTLAQFYLGRIMERHGKKVEAMTAYQEFISHFEDSTARLPQVAEARSALKRLM